MKSNKRKLYQFLEKNLDKKIFCKSLWKEVFEHRNAKKKLLKIFKSNNINLLSMTHQLVAEDRGW